jgi:hypothetical protein
VLLKNVHLAPQWLVQLEKKIHTLVPHAGFRLFLTTEINPKLPVNLLRSSRVFVYEPAAGIKSNMFRTLNSIPPEKMSAQPAERARIYVLLAWLHAVIQERLRYAPLGWSKRYEFNDADLRSALDTVDTWIDTASKGRSNLPPNKIPWAALRTLLSQAVYGGKIDNETDQRLLDSFVDQIFTEKRFLVAAFSSSCSFSVASRPHSTLLSKTLTAELRPSRALKALHASSTCNGWRSSRRSSHLCGLACLPTLNGCCSQRAPRSSLRMS